MPLLFLVRLRMRWGVEEDEMIENHRGHQHLTKTTLIALAEGTLNIHKISLLCLCLANSLNPLTMILVNPAEEHRTTVKINSVVLAMTSTKW